MGTWIQLILHSLQLIGKFYDLWREQDQRKAQAKKEALNEVMHGAAESDASRITKGFDMFNSVR